MAQSEERKWRRGIRTRILCPVHRGMMSTCLFLAIFPLTAFFVVEYTNPLHKQTNKDTYVRAYAVDSFVIIGLIYGFFGRFY